MYGSVAREGSSNPWLVASTIWPEICHFNIIWKARPWTCKRQLWHISAAVRLSRSQLLAWKNVLNFSAIHFFHSGTLSFYLQSLLHLIHFWAFLVNVCGTQHASEAQVTNFKIRKGILLRLGVPDWSNWAFSFREGNKSPSVVFSPYFNMNGDFPTIWWYPSLKLCKKSGKRLMLRKGTLILWSSHRQMTFLLSHREKAITLEDVGRPRLSLQLVPRTSPYTMFFTFLSGAATYLEFLMPQDT